MAERPGNYWYMLPEYSQARKAMWDAINPKTGQRRIDDAFPKELRENTKEQEMMIKFKGTNSTFQLVGSDNFNSLVGTPPVGLVFSEYALSRPSAWAYLMPIVEENGGWVGFNSTPRGKNHFKNMSEFASKEPGWFYSHLTADQTGIFAPEQLQSILRQLQSDHGDEFGHSLWLQEYFCSFDAALPGAIWADCITRAESEGRIGMVPHTEGYPVFTGWDLGYDDDTAGWFYQVVHTDAGPELRFIDFYADNFKDVDHYATMLYTKSLEKGYTYGTHWLPHDARPRTLAAGGKSILQQFKAYQNDIGQFRIAPKLDVQEGIQAVRASFPFMRIDAVACEDGLDACKSYVRVWDDEKKIFSTSPKHDWASHAADGLRTVGVTWQVSAQDSPRRPLREALLAGSVGQATFGQIRAQHFKRMKQKRNGY